MCEVSPLGPDQGVDIVAGRSHGLELGSEDQLEVLRSGLHRMDHQLIAVIEADHD